MTFSDLLELPAPDAGAVNAAPAVSPVRVRAARDLFWSDGEALHPHARAGEAGEVRYVTTAGFLVWFESGEVRQVMRSALEDELVPA